MSKNRKNLEQKYLGKIAKFKRLITIVFLLITVTSQTFAQQPGGAGGPPPGADGKVATSTGPKRHLATIIFAGLGGAMLGLSTLSFYGRPQDYLGNIAIGFAIGIIGGTIYVTYKAATKPDDFYGPPTANFREQSPQVAALSHHPEVHMLNMRWEF